MLALCDDATLDTELVRQAHPLRKRWMVSTMCNETRRTKPSNPAERLEDEQAEQAEQQAVVSVATK